LVSRRTSPGSGTRRDRRSRGTTAAGEFTDGKMSRKDLFWKIVD
jgi:hypothetical protein